LDNLQIGSIDTQNRSHCVIEGRDSIVLIEVSDSSLQANGKHDSITRSDQESAAWLNPELKRVGQSKISMLTAIGTCWDSPVFSHVVPASWLDWLLQHIIDLECASFRVSNCDQTTSGSVTVKCESLGLWRRASVINGVVLTDLEYGWEALLTELASVSTVPTLIHVSIQSVVEACDFINDEKWRHVSIHTIFILGFEQKNSKIVILAHVTIPVCYFCAA